MFKIKLSNQIEEKGELFYNHGTNEFHSEPSEESDITFLVAYITIGFSSLNNQSTQIWGYHNSGMWEEKQLSMPQADWGKLVIEDSSIEGGDTIRLPQAEEWETYFDKKENIVYFGNPNMRQAVQYVKIFSGTVVGIDKQGEIQELWLQPKIL